jgi:uncharacterized protein (DUF697 family)
MIDVREELQQSAQRLLQDVIVSRAVASLSVDERTRLMDDLDLIKRAITTSHIPKLVLVGDPQIPGQDALRQLGGEPLTDASIHEEIGRGRWQTWSFPNGNIDVADLRASCTKALRYERPDATLMLLPSNRADVAPWVKQVLEVQETTQEEWDITPPLIVAIHRRNDQREVGDFVSMQAVKAALVQAGFPRDFAQVVQLSRTGKLVRALMDVSPEELRFALARLTPEPGAKHQMAESLIRVATSVNATISTIPLPFASSLPITSVQALMIGGIAWISGREINAKSVGEFAAAIGLNVGASFAFRELARALINSVPVAGSLISSSIAAGATRSLGVAARRYFIDRQSSNLVD